MKLLLPTLAIFIIPLNLQAGIVLSVDMDTGFAGLQGSRETKTGDQFDVGLFIELTGTTQLTSYTLSARFNSTRLEFVGGSDPNPDGFDAGSTSVLFDLLPSSAQFSEVDSIDAFSFGGGRQAADGRENPFQIATLTFKTIGMPSLGSDTDIVAGLFKDVNSQNGFSDGAFNSIDTGIQMRGGTLNITSVPEPSASMLVCLVLVGLRMRRTRKH